MTFPSPDPTNHAPTFPSSSEVISTLLTVGTAGSFGFAGATDQDGDPLNYTIIGGDIAGFTGS